MTAREIAVRKPGDLPPILLGRATPAVQEKVEKFFLSVAEIFEAWVTRRSSPHTQRAYRQDVMAFVAYLGIPWPKEAHQLFTVSLGEVLGWREHLKDQGAAPKTLNRRISSLSSFYKYLAAAAAELRLPITVPNPAHAQFIARENTDPREETRHLTATRARQLMALPAGDTLVDFRDRAILKTYLYTGARLAAVCRLKVSDFHDDEEDARLSLTEKGGKHRTIGIHPSCRDAIREYLGRSEITAGPLFRPRLGPYSQRLSDRVFSPTAMYHLLLGYLEQLPGALRDKPDPENPGQPQKNPDGSTVRECVYNPHSIRATTATLLLDVGVDIRKVQELLGHRHVTTTQIYDKRRRTTKESASHDVPV
jgi:site-specific recombinase XerD